MRLLALSLPFESSASCCKASAASMVELSMVALLPPVAKRVTRLSAIIAMRFCCSELSVMVLVAVVTVLTAAAVGATDEASSAIWAVWPVLAGAAFASAAFAGVALAGAAMNMLLANAAAARTLMLLCAVIKALLLAVVWGGAAACGGAVACVAADVALRPGCGALRWRLVCRGWDVAPCLRVADARAIKPCCCASLYGKRAPCGCRWCPCCRLRLGLAINFLDYACIDSKKGVKYLLALGPLAQLAEQGTLNPKVQGSNP